jgi:hypothetical protein
MNKNVTQPFESILSIGEQQKWFDNPTNINESIHDRLNNPNRNFDANNHFAALENFPDFYTLQQILRQYVQKCIPAYRRTEGGWWVVSCLPTSTPNRLSAISLNWMETFVIFHSEDKEHISQAFIIVSESEFRSAYPNDIEFYKEYADTELARSTYKAAENDQIRISMNSIYSIISILQNSVVLQASRDLNLKLMSRGRTPYSKFHSFELADLLVE